MPDAELTAIWRYIPLDEFVSPSASAKETVRKGLFGLLDQLKPAPPTAEPAIEQDALQRLPEDRLSRAAPEPDWTASASALQVVLQPALDQGIAPVQVVVGAPHSGVDKVLTKWAGMRELVIVEPPRPEQLLAGGSEWLSYLAEIDPTAHLVIPTLERYYLRHHHGLGLMRRLLVALAERHGPCAMGCSSWAWSYLVRTLRVHAFARQPWTLEPLTQEQLQVWFNSQASQQGDSHYQFRKSDDGKFITPPVATVQTDPPPVLSDFLVNLAARSRGNPGVALALWRHSLRIAPELDADHSQNEPAPSEACTLWVKPWSQLRLPELADSHERSALQLLHTLLLHEGLQATLLAELLPSTQFEIMALLSRLERQHLVMAVGDEWHVTALGYPAVREALRVDGYLVDAL